MSFGIFFPFLSAIFLILSFPPALNRWFIFFALVPLFFYLDHVSSKKRAFWTSWISGFIFIGWGIKWFFNVLPTTWAGIENPAIGYIVVGVLWFCATASISVFIGFFGYLWHKIPPQKKLLIPFLWIILEYFRGIFFSILWAGDGSLIGPYWTFGVLGYTLANFPLLLQGTKLFGLYGASLLIVFINVLLYKSLRDGINRMQSGICVSLIGVLIFYGFLKINSTETGNVTIKKIALIQTDAPTHSTHSINEFKEYVQTEIELLKESSSYDPDLIVLPESSRLTLYFTDKTPQIFTEIFGSKKPRKIIDSGKISPYGPSVERIFHYEIPRGIVAIGDKQFTMPGGEYLPYLVEFPSKIFGLKEWVDNYNLKRKVISGPQNPIHGFEIDQEPEGTLLCSGIWTPSFWRKLSSKNGEILINSASQSLLRGSSQFYGQTEAMFRFFAASNDRWFLQAANSGYSYVIDSRGFIQKRTRELGNVALLGKAEYRKTKPPYVRMGDWPVFSAFLLILICFFRQKLSTEFYTRKYSIIKVWLSGR